MSSPLRLRSTRARYTLTMGVLALVIFGAVGILIDLAIRNALRDDINENAERVALQWVGTMRPGGPPSTVDNFSRINLLQLVDSRGRVVSASREAAGRPPLSTVRPSAESRLQEVTECSTADGCVVLTALRVAPELAQRLWNDNPRVVYAGMKEPPILATHRLEALTGAGVLSAVVVTVWVTWFMVGRTLRPVAAIREQTSKITVSDLSLRVPEPPGRGEIAQLARVVNQTLARLEEAVGQQRRFLSDASHELRTPIAGLRAQLEESLLFQDDVDPYCTIQGALSATGRLEAIVEDLMALARLRADELVPPERIDLGVLVQQESRAQSNGVPVHAQVKPGVWVRGHRVQLIRLVDNLLANARRHADHKVEAAVETREGTAVVTVTDDGPGIAPQDRERVFERFTRLEDARRRDPGGSGLGLAISREIARAHHGTLTIEDSPRGARFVLRLPLSDA